MEGRLEFRLKECMPKPPAYALLVAFLLAITAILVSLGELAVLSLPEVGFGLVMFATVALVMAWSLVKGRQGVVVVDKAGVTVRTGFALRSYPWLDIASISEQHIGDARRSLDEFIFGTDASWAIVRLKRAERYGLWGLRFGTRVLGVPLSWSRSIALPLEDAEEFIEACRPFLHPNAPRAP